MQPKPKLGKPSGLPDRVNQYFRCCSCWRFSRSTQTEFIAAIKAQAKLLDTYAVDPLQIFGEGLYNFIVGQNVLDHLNCGIGRNSHDEACGSKEGSGHQDDYKNFRG